MIPIYRYIIVLILLFPGVHYAQTDTISISNILDLSLDELLHIKVVSAGKRAQSQSEIPASVEVITRQDIEKFGYTTLKEILNQVTGLYIWDGYHVRGRVNIGIRGFTSSDNVIILVNGVNQVEGVYNEYLLTKVGVPVEAIQRIEVVKGPMTLLYGSGAFFGVINIITNDIKSSDKNKVSASYGSNKHLKGMARANMVSKDFRVAITASANKSDGMDVPYSEMMSDPKKLLNWGLDVNATSKGMLQDQRGYFNVTGNFKNLSFDMTHTEVERGGFLVQPTIQYSPTKRHSTNFLTSYKHEFSDKLSLKAKFSYLTTSSLAFYYLNEENSYFSFGYNSDAYEVEALSYIKPTETLNITIGLWHRNIYYATNPAELEGAWGVPYGKHLTRLATNSRMITNAMFSQVEYKPFKGFSLIGGIRFQHMLPYDYEASGGVTYVKDGREHYSDTYDYNKIYAIPSLSAIYSINKQTFKLLYGEALRNPPLGKITDILFSTANSNTDFPQLVPSKIKTIELNHSGLYGKKLTSNFSVFYNDLSNLISQYFIDINDSTTTYYTSNKGKIATVGTEISIGLKPIKDLSINFGLMYQKSESLTDKVEKVNVPYCPEIVGNIRVSYTIAQKFTIYSTAQYLGSMETEYDYENHRRLGEPTAASTLIDGGLIVSNLMVPGLKIHLKSTNLLDGKIHYPTTTLNQFADKGILEYPRRYFIELTYNF